MIDIGKLTEEQTYELAQACIHELTDEKLYELLNSLPREVRDECAAAWSRDES